MKDSLVSQSILSEYFYYFIITAILFLLFFFLITIFGLILCTIIETKYMKNENRINGITKIFLSFAIGISIFISLAHLFIIFKLFNFFFVYLPLIIIDSLYFIYLWKKGILSFTKIKNLLKNIRFSPKDKQFLYFKIVCSLLFIIILQYITQVPVLLKSKSLISEDPYYYLGNVYHLKDRQTISPLLNMWKILGNIIIVSGITLITPDYVITYYFLKLGSIYFLSLYLILIFYIGYKIFHKIYMGVICSVLLSSFYLYIWALNGLYSYAVAGIFVGISILIFLEDKKYLLILGFIIPLIFLTNQAVMFFSGLLYIIYFIIIIVLNKNDFKIYFKIFISIVVLIFLLFIPYLFYLHYINSDVFTLIEAFLDMFNLSILFRPSKNLMSFLNELSIFLSNERFLIYTSSLVQNIIDFIKQPRLSIAFITLSIYLFYTIFGFFYKSNEENTKRVILISKLAIFLIIFTYGLKIIYLNQTFFFYRFQDRIFAVYCPFLVLFSSFGIYKLEQLFRQLSKFLKKKYWMKYKLVINKNIVLKYFKIDYFIFFLFLSSMVYLNLSQRELIEEFGNYNFEDSEIEALLFIRTEAPSNSVIFSTYFRNKGHVRWLLYDMEIIFSNFTNEIKFKEFNEIIKKYSVDFVLLRKEYLNSHFLMVIHSYSEYMLIYENSNFFIYEIQY